MVDHSLTGDAEFLRERAAKLREIATQMPPTIRDQLLDVAAQLEVRASGTRGGSYGQHSKA